MTSLRQFSANRRNATLSSGPQTTEGKRRSRRNAVRHGLTASVVVDVLESSEDFAAFHKAIVQNYKPRSTMKRELVSQLSSLLWRLRRARTIENGFFKLHTPPQGQPDKRQSILLYRKLGLNTLIPRRRKAETIPNMADLFIRMSNRSGPAWDRLRRYEIAVWRQIAQSLVLLGSSRGSLNRSKVRRTRRKRHL
jgi:hypothetical protein